MIISKVNIFFIIFFSLFLILLAFPSIGNAATDLEILQGCIGQTATGVCENADVNGDNLLIIGAPDILSMRNLKKFDLNDNGTVEYQDESDGSDLSIMRDCIGQTATGFCANTNFNGDSLIIIGAPDLFAFRSVSSFDLNNNGIVEYSESSLLLCGDVNADGHVTELDANLIFDHVRGLNPDIKRLDLCDVGGNIGCSATDATIIYNYSQGNPDAIITQQCVPEVSQPDISSTVCTEADFSGDGIVNTADFFGYFRPDVNKYDLDNDGSAEMGIDDIPGDDFNLFLSCFSNSPSGDCLRADFNGDGAVNTIDFFGYFRPDVNKYDLDNDGSAEMGTDDAPGDDFNLFLSCFGSTIESSNLKVSSGQTPVISSITPSSAKYGEIVTIVGNNFNSGSYVAFLGKSFTAITISYTANTLQFRVPQGIEIGTYAIAIKEKASDVISSETIFTVLNSNEENSKHMCGDVNGDGQISTVDADIIRESLLVPPLAIMFRPDLCDVGDSIGCTSMDSAIIEGSLANPPTANIVKQCTGAIGSLKITSPNGGENLKEGTKHRITWDTAGTINYVTVGYTTPSEPNSFRYIARNIPNSGFYDWNIGYGLRNLSSQYIIKIENNPAPGERLIQDESDLPFAIKQNLNPTPESERVRILSPNGGEALKWGESYKISWTRGKNIVKIGVVGDDFNSVDNNLIGWISTTESPNSSLLWDSKTLCDLSGTRCFNMDADISGPYKILAVSEDVHGNYCTASAYTGCGNWDISDSSFYLVYSTIKPTDPVTQTPILSIPTIKKIFVRDLWRGIKNEEVHKLQEYLSKDPELYPQGIISGYYGKLTEAAIQKFQCKYNIVCSGSPDSTGYGLVGPKTRVKLNEVFSNETTSSQTPTTNNTTHEQSTTDSLQQQIQQLIKQIHLLQLQINALQ